MVLLDFSLCSPSVGHEWRSSFRDFSVNSMVMKMSASVQFLDTSQQTSHHYSLLNFNSGKIKATVYTVHCLFLSFRGSTVVSNWNILVNEKLNLTSKINKLLLCNSFIKSLLKYLAKTFIQLTVPVIFYPQDVAINMHSNFQLCRHHIKPKRGNFVEVKGYENINKVLFLSF